MLKDHLKQVISHGRYQERGTKLCVEITKKFKKTEKRKKH